MTTKKDIQDFKKANIILQEMYSEFNLMYFGGECPDITVSFNKRLTRCAGRVRSSQSRFTGECTVKFLEMSWDIFTRMNFDWNSFADTFVHEMVHVWTIHCHNVGGHDGLWHKKMCQIFGNRTQKEFQFHNFSLRYVLHCNACGRKVGEFGTKKSERKYGHHTSKCCNSRLSLWDNNRANWVWQVGTGKRAEIAA